LLVKEGILAGSSSGTLLAAALRFCRAQTEPKRVVTLVPDSGAKYLSKVFNDAWLLEQGFVRRDATGDVRDLVTRRHTEGATITVAPTDTLRIAYTRMRSADVSQLPVLDRGRLVGLVDESDLLRVISAAGDETQEAFGRPVYEAMVTRLTTLPAHAPIAALHPIFAADQVAIVVEDGRFYGLVARVDLLNFILRSDR
jgi:cystathionine beta-synthase